MSPLDTSDERELARRVGAALAARARLRDVDASQVRDGLARVRAAAGAATGVADDSGAPPAVELEVGGDDDEPAGRRRSRLLLAAVASAAAAAVVVAAALGLAHREGGAPAPAATAQPSPSSSSVPGEEWAGFWGLAHEQWPSDLEGVGPLGGDVVAGSVRLLVQLDQVRYWAGFTADGRLCWKVVGPGTDAGGCELEAGAPRVTEVSDGSVAPQVWLVPQDAPPAQTDPLTADGLVEWTPGVWAEASALTPPLSQYQRFRDAPTAADEVPASSAIVVRDPVVPGSMRFLHRGAEGTFFTAYLPLGKLCLFFDAPEGGMSASTCQTPQQLAGEGFSGLTRQEDTEATAWLVPDDLDTSGWAALGRRQLAKNLWFESRPLPPHTPEPVRSLTPEEEQALREQQAEIANQAAISGPIAPDVLGLSQAEATQRLESYGIRVGEVTVQAAGSAPSGMVIRVTPPAGTQVPEGTAAQLVVAQ